MHMCSCVLAFLCSCACMHLLIFSSRSFCSQLFLGMFGLAHQISIPWYLLCCFNPLTDSDCDIVEVVRDENRALIFATNGIDFACCYWRNIGKLSSCPCSPLSFLLNLPNLLALLLGPLSSFFAPSLPSSLGSILLLLHLLASDPG